MSARPLILVTNDDGITAPGIRMLISVMNKIGDVVVVAPDSPQSAMGHAITLNSTLHMEKITVDGKQPEYSSLLMVNNQSIVALERLLTV